jgi:eukaryotic-like serine/threonine-protein kinase
MSKVTCVVCGHTEHGDSSYCMNPSCGELLPVAERPTTSPPEPTTPTADIPSEPPADLPAPQIPPVAPQPARRRSAVASVSSARRWLLASAVVVVLLGLGVAFSRGAATPTPSSTPPEALPRASVVAAMAPKITAMQDERVAVTLTLTDNSDGKAAFYVVGGPVGRQPTTMAEAKRGSTSVRVPAVNPEAEYCFVVVAVLSVDEVAPSAQMCTSRFGTPK